LMQPGDLVLLVFGINDGGLRTPPGLGDELDPATGYHTYGWYMSKMATDAVQKGARVFLLTVTPRNIWTNPRATFRDATILTQQPGYSAADDRIERGTGEGRYTQWTKDVGRALNLPVLDLTNLLADRYEKTGRAQVMVNYKDHNHTYPAGADIVASTIVAGLRAFAQSPFTPLLSAKGRAIEAADRKYVTDARPPATAVANHAESGESVAGALGKGRFDKIWAGMKPGDFLLLQCGIVLQ
jgi:lysophospholipase L1-like esterase